MKLKFSQQIFKNSSNIIFHETPCSGSRVVACWQTAGRTKGRDAVNNRFLLFCERVIIKAKNVLCADYCHQPVNSLTLRHISWHYVQQYFFKCRPSPWVRENRLYFRAEEHFECQLLYLLSDFRHIWYSRFTGNAISCFCLCVPYQLAHKRRILFKGFNECFPYFLHILPHLEVVRYGKCTKIFSDFQLHKNGALIDIHSIA